MGFSKRTAPIAILQEVWSFDTAASQPRFTASPRLICMHSSILKILLPSLTYLQVRHERMQKVMDQLVYLSAFLTTSPTTSDDQLGFYVPVPLTGSRGLTTNKLSYSGIFLARILRSISDEADWSASDLASHCTALDGYPERNTGLPCSYLDLMWCCRSRHRRIGRRAKDLILWSF